jgi:hypothetical protein
VISTAVIPQDPGKLANFTVIMGHSREFDEVEVKI